MNVKLIGFTPNPEKLPAMAAKLTHDITKPEELDKSSDKELKAILEHVMNLGHTPCTVDLVPYAYASLRGISSRMYLRDGHFPSASQEPVFDSLVILSGLFYQ